VTGTKSKHARAIQDLRTLVDNADRHLAAFDAGEDADRHLHAAVTALGHLVSNADALLAPLASESVARQTDRGDALGEFFAEVVGDREYGFDPDARPAGGAS
jgi:hypothetical protein